MWEDELDEIERLYVGHEPLLRYIGERQFGLPAEVTTTFEQEVFLSYLQTGVRIDNLRAWLAQAMCNASRHYIRLTSCEGSPAENDFAVPELEEDATLIRQAMSFLQPRSQEVLQLAYGRRLKIEEIAREMETTPRYVDRLIHNSVKRLLEIVLHPA